ncbi:Nif3-like dinuclear metal center hexameric protein [Ligilactobacillus sp. WILCCON 0076]|uniref:GTP cyclohydrolase 1 type 2 homolog n=1 Tax=Ligilactobacillus ubinensis TaxID=2876789 RepID=A0A9X2FLY5_9LACO|nr:Nif3-like dinuclear metal center hexameric protein [Ligilactobacillus ubinensis]MCP0888041.1 Nif3-like dinuclear metal center hexameric protein [Ligilactobacillus ubinensis]
MEITEIIQRIKNYYQGMLNGQRIDDEKTRDQVLYGSTKQECTGIVTTIWASTAVIEQAARLGANLIICHEALFWNHGDQQQWLKESNNQTYLAKKALLDKNHITVWRNHDYVHSGIPVQDGTYCDGIFWGFAKYMGWEEYFVKPAKDKLLPIMFNLPETKTINIANELIARFKLEGARIEGDPNTIVKKAIIPYHNLGDAKQEIELIDKEKIDLVIGMELIDFTLAEYIHDSSMLGKNKSIVTVGHFNTEEAGMRYMAEYIPGILKNNILCQFVQAGDMYHYVTDLK